MHRFTGALLTIMVVAAGCGGGVQQLAKETCAELEGAVILTAGSIVSAAVAKAEDMGSSGAELGDAMRAECPGIMDALENVGEEQERREALPGQMDLEVTGCTDDGASGTVTNGSDVTVDIFIDVQYLDSSGTVVDDGIASISGLRPGETGNWDSGRIDDSDIARCRADVDDAYQQ